MVIKSPKQAYEWAYVHGLTFPSSWYITPNFKWNEVFVNETASDGIPIYEVFQNAYKLGQHIQFVRQYLGKPVIVHSWVRQIPHNKRAGSTAKYSGHLNGLAVDFHIDGMTDEDVRNAIIEMGIPVRIEANTKGWVHIDINNYVARFTPGLFYV